MIKSANLFLSFNGNCKDALNFYKDTFDAKIIECVTYGEAEMASKDSETELIMNSSIILGNLHISCTDNLNYDTISGNQTSIWLEIDNEENFMEIYNKFNDILLKKEETFWNSIYAKVKDNFGVIWELNYQK